MKATIEPTAMLRHLAVPEARPAGRPRFTPIVGTDTRLDTCSPWPWAHVRLGQPRGIREGYAALLRERVARTAPPRPVPAPSTACLRCGVATVLVSALDLARDVPV